MLKKNKPIFLPMTTSRREFLKYGGTAALALSIMPFLSKAELNNILKVDVAGNLLRATPESQGVDSAGISRFLLAAQDSGLQWHSFMLLRRGNVIAEGWWKPFEPSYKHTLYSLSKSFASTGIGLLVKDGKLNVDDQVISLFPDYLPADVTENLRKMKIRHLLSMNTGHDEDTTPKMREGTESWIKTFFAVPVVHAPGSHFLYNSGATYMLGAIVKKITGQDLEDFLRQRLFTPLGITDLDWEKSPEGLSVAGWGLRLKAEDIAKLGQLYLQRGKWDGKEILGEAWVEEASSAQTTSNPGDSDWSQGYGYQFWRCKPGFFRGDGAFGQYCIVMPQHEAVLVVNSESWDMGKQMAIMWETLLPAMKSSPLPSNESSLKKLKGDIAALSLPTTKGTIKPIASKLTNTTFRIDKNEFGVSHIGIKHTDKGPVLTISSDRGMQVVKAGWENWVTNNESKPYLLSVPNRNPVPSKIAATATWIADKMLQMDLKFVEAIHTDKLTFRFEDKALTLSMMNSVSENTKNNPEKRIELKGETKS
jgi:hypothetical protein